MPNRNLYVEMGNALWGQDAEEPTSELRRSLLRLTREAIDAPASFLTDLVDAGWERYFAAREAESHIEWMLFEIPQGPRVEVFGG